MIDSYNIEELRIFITDAQNLNKIDASRELY